MPFDYSNLTVLKRVEETEYWLTPKSFVVAYVEDGFSVEEEDNKRVLGSSTPLRFTDVAEDQIVYESEEWRRAYAARVLLASFELEHTPENCVPTGVAVDGRPAIAVYLFAFQRRDEEEVAQLLDIEPETVRRYKRRLERELHGY